MSDLGPNQAGGVPVAHGESDLLVLYVSKTDAALLGRTLGSLEINDSALGDAGYQASLLTKAWEGAARYSTTWRSGRVNASGRHRGAWAFAGFRRHRPPRSLPRSAAPSASWWS